MKIFHKNIRWVARYFKIKLITTRPRYTALTLCFLFIVTIALALSIWLPRQSFASQSQSFVTYLPFVSKSPNVFRIAYTSDNLGCCSDSLLVMDSEGSHSFTVMTLPHLGSHAWSPNGKQMVFSGSDQVQGDGIYRIDVNGANLTKLITLTYAPIGNSWSHDGTQIVFSYKDDIYKMQADGSNLTQLTMSAGRNMRPRWSPNDQFIVFDSYRNGKSSIYIMNSDGSNQHLIGNANASDIGPLWSPDGTQIAFTRLITEPIYNSIIYVMNADGTNERPVFSFGPGGDDIYATDWSPDSQYLLYWQSYMHFNYIGITNLDGTDWRTIRFGLYPRVTPFK